MSESSEAFGQAREWYSPHEIATILGRAGYTVREWCRHGRLKARKRACGRGRHLGWEIHVDELSHYLNHGLRPAVNRNVQGEPSCC